MSLVANGHWIFAQRRADLAWVGVLEVLNGRGCDCICPECGQPLIAKQGPQRAAHFAHAATQGGGCGMGFWHTVIRDTFVQLNQISFNKAAPVHRLAGLNRVLRTEREASVLGNEFRIDALLWLQCGLRIAVEVVDTHDIEGVKLAALQQEGYQVLRIDVAAVRRAMQSLPATTENLSKLLARAGEWQTWPQIASQPTQGSLPVLFPCPVLARAAKDPWRRILDRFEIPWLAPQLQRGKCQ